MTVGAGDKTKRGSFAMDGKGSAQGRVHSALATSCRRKAHWVLKVSSTRTRSHHDTSDHLRYRSGRGRRPGDRHRPGASGDRTAGHDHDLWQRGCQHRDPQRPAAGSTGRQVDSGGPGAAAPLVKPRHPAPAHIHGANGLGDIELPSLQGQAESRSAAQFIVDTVNARPGEVSLVAVGPLGNLAAALQLDPCWSTRSSRWW
ncbi:pyrimidine-specific ribonucleoside hydrolase RihB [Halomonas elongata]|uniref:Pyrimidine-specific ribonucleoside hydrolase RihB n=1 Tax=Halomonas elongata TaxID=2746 RepID=A0A1B8P2C3_HALEL|nr:pyrimidine-specific ribonucleoside hydrolase RihB [Halomonas elongata]